MIDAKCLVKRYGAKTAVDDLTFKVKPGIVTGFLGPNGSGKSTTMRLIIGPDAPTRGSKAVHGGRSARNHLLAIAATSNIPTGRVDELLGLVGLQDVARKRVKGFSLGMGQRLGIAAALLGDPATLILDEPVNGLDPEGILWIRNLLRTLAREGRTILVSSHLMSEMALTADHLIVIGRGRLIADVSVDEFTAQAQSDSVTLRTSPEQTSRLRAALVAAGVSAAPTGPGRLEVTGLSCDRIGDIALAKQIPIYELVPQMASLEQAFMQLTRDAVEYQTPPLAPASPGKVA